MRDKLKERNCRRRMTEREEGREGGREGRKGGGTSNTMTSGPQLTTIISTLVSAASVFCRQTQTYTNTESHRVSTHTCRHRYTHIYR